MRNSINPAEAKIPPCESCGQKIDDCKCSQKQLDEVYKIKIPTNGKYKVPKKNRNIIVVNFKQQMEKL